MKASKVRREKLFRTGKPVVRPAEHEDIRWFWVAARRAGYDGTSEDFGTHVQPQLAQADKLFVLEDRNNEFATGKGPVGLVMANYDGWSLFPHVEWFQWATNRNKLRCTVAFLQTMRYTRDVGSVKIFATDEYVAWFKWLRRYLPIFFVGKIPGGRSDSTEWIFYLRGRRNEHKNAVRRVEVSVGRQGIDYPETAARHTTH